MKRNDEALFLTAAVDGELDIGRNIALQRRLAEDAALKAAWDGQLALRASIRKSASYHNAPADLRARLHVSCAQPLNDPPLAAPAGRTGVSEHRRRWALAAGLAGVASVVSAAMTLLAVRGQDHALANNARLVDALVASHVRAALLSQQIEIASSDQHTVRPWLSARMTFSPTVPDLAAQGFELTGGRRDVIDARPVAVLVYRRRQHVISVFVSPEPAPSAMAPQLRRGFNVVGTMRGGMSYLLVSDLGLAELQAMAGLMRDDQGTER